MANRGVAALLLFLLAASASCGIKQQVKGQYFLKTGQFEQGAKDFRAELEENPDNPAANYFMGRFLLGEERPDKAADHLARAVKNAPGNADYRFWYGVALGENGDEAGERHSYQAALRIDPDHLTARTYLAHLQLKAGEDREALENYSMVLGKRPYSAQPLYNRALILGRMGRTPEEQAAWKIYLAAWPDGPLARLAANHLNALGDFSYRNHIMGKRVVTLEKIAFEPLTAKITDNKSASLDLVGEILERSPELRLHVVAYQLNNPDLAKNRARAVSRYLEDNFKIPPPRISASWFAVPEKIETGGATFHEPESVNLFAFKPEPK